MLKLLILDRQNQLPKRSLQDVQKSRGVPSPACKLRDSHKKVAVAHSVQKRTPQQFLTLEDSLIEIAAKSNT